MPIYHGFTYDISPEERARNEFNTCLHFLRSCKHAEEGRSAQAEYWICRVFAAWRQLEPFATLQERRLFERCLLDIMAIDPAHKTCAFGTPGWFEACPEVVF